jgi:hypothetical protein
MSCTTRRSVSASVAVALGQAAHRFDDRMFGPAAHLRDEGAKPVQILVERLERMSLGRH